VSFRRSFFVLTLVITPHVIVIKLHGGVTSVKGELVQNVTVLLVIPWLRQISYSILIMFSGS
jgi:hypothetical protein